jgi:hypothetical protein
VNKAVQSRIRALSCFKFGLLCDADSDASAAAFPASPAMSAKSCTAQLVADQGQLCGMTGEARVGVIDTRDIAPVAATLLTSLADQGTSYFGAHDCAR